jgi:tRNA wybutosine-synthesizing protein 1
MTPWLSCNNKCIHCWRPIELDFKKLIKKGINSPKEIISGAIKNQQKLLEGFKGNKKINLKKFKEAQEPDQFAISLLGEPTIYPKIGDFIEELRKQNKTSFLVTNGLHPDVLEKLYKKNQLPTQLYLSVNTSNKEGYIKFHRSNFKNAWEKLNKTLEMFPKFNKKTRTVFRMNLVLDLNMYEEQIPEYVELIKKAQPLIIEVKGFMSVGFARERLGYERMPREKEMKNFVKKLEKNLQDQGLNYKFLDEHKFSRAYVLAKNKKDLKIKKSEI